MNARGMSRNSEFRREFNKRQEMFDMCYEKGEFQEEIPPSQFVAWLVKHKFPLEAHLHVLIRKSEEGAPEGDLEFDDLNGKTRNYLYSIMLGMLFKNYDVYVDLKVNPLKNPMKYIVGDVEGLIEDVSKLGFGRISERGLRTRLNAAVSWAIQDKDLTLPTTPRSRSDRS